jgi:hypothetical protein
MQTTATFKNDRHTHIKSHISGNKNVRSYLLLKFYEIYIQNNINNHTDRHTYSI